MGKLRNVKVKRSLSDNRLKYAQRQWDLSKVNHPPLPGTVKKENFSFTGAITFGASVGLDVNIKGTPISLQASVSAGETDLIGWRDNNFTLGGKTSDGTEKSRNYVSIGGMGMGASETIESTMTADGKYSEKLTRSSGAMGVTEEEVYDDIFTIQGSIPKMEGSFQINIKAAALIGIDVQAKIPWFTAKPQSGLPPGNYPDNTNHKPIILPTNNKKP